MDIELHNAESKPVLKAGTNSSALLPPSRASREDSLTMNTAAVARYSGRLRNGRNRVNLTSMFLRPPIVTLIRCVTFIVPAVSKQINDLFRGWEKFALKAVICRHAPEKPAFLPSQT
jgi:hypothetical protein